MSYAFLASGLLASITGILFISMLTELQDQLLLSFRPAWFLWFGKVEWMHPPTSKYCNH